jgi:hypothetical protein
MNKTTKRIQFLVEEINKTDEDTRENVIIILTFPFAGFYRRCKSVSNFLKILTNGKNTLTGSKSNREWFKTLNADGFTRYNITREIVEIILVLKTSERINELELKSRVSKIIKPLEVVLSYDVKYLLNKKFIDVLNIETGMSLLGDYRRISV